MGEIVPKEIPLVAYPYYLKHNPNVPCVFHTGYIGHSTEDFLVFKNKVQDLIYQKIMSFIEENPNIRTNPLPTHNVPAVSAVIKEEGT